MVKSSLQKMMFYAKAYRRLELMNRAASLSYYTVISIFPTLLVLIVISSLFFSPEALQGEIKGFLEKALPFESDLVLQNMNALFRHKLSLSSFSVIMLFVSAQMLYVNLEKIINSILHTDRKRHFLITRLLFFVWLLSMIVILFAPVLVTFVSGILQFLNIPVEFWTKISGHVGFFLTSALMFLLILLILPTRRLNTKRLIQGACGFAVTIQIGKLLFKFITLRSLSRYNLVYGSLSSTMLVMIWVFYFYNVLLFFVYWTGRHHDPYHQNLKTEISKTP